MSIFEYDEEKEMIYIRQAEREIGELIGQVSLARKKSNKGMSVQEISELLEEREECIEEILKEIESNPTANDEEIALSIVRR